MARRRARELAFRTLFESERGGEPILEVWDQVREELGESDVVEVEDPYGDVLDVEGLAFADRLVRSFSAHAQEIDEQLTGSIQGWSFGQMNQTDLNVLRLALTEMRFEKDIPTKVTIEMAVRTAKKFGGEDSGRFVNGVLARVYRDLPADSPAAPAEDRPSSGAAEQPGDASTGDSEDQGDTDR